MLNISLWILQSLLAFIFLYQGLCKTFFRKRDMAYFGQTSMVGMPVSWIRFIGICEILGAYGLVIPIWLKILPGITPVASLGLAFIMILAAGVNSSKKIYRNIYTNIILFLLCIFIYVGRTFL